VLGYVTTLPRLYRYSIKPQRSRAEAKVGQVRLFSEIRPLPEDATLYRPVVNDDPALWRTCVMAGLDDTWSLRFRQNWLKPDWCFGVRDEAFLDSLVAVIDQGCPRLGYSS